MQNNLSHNAGRPRRRFPLPCVWTGYEVESVAEVLFGHYYKTLEFNGAAS
jgi:hypothetical protein